MRLVAIAFALLSCAVAAAPAPRADHHQHLLSAAAASWLNRVAPPATPLPKAAEALLVRRVAAWNDRAKLAALYAGDALMLDLDTPAWLHGPTEIASYASKRFRAPYRMLPSAVVRRGDAWLVAGFYARDEGDGLNRIGRFQLELREASPGEWRIALEAPAWPGPPFQPAIDAAGLVALLDEAGIEKAAVLSEAYWFDAPDAGLDAEAALARVREENDWTATQAERHPQRLFAFCSFNPLAPHALGELARCADSRRFAGIKLHMDSSGVDLGNRDHLAKLRAVLAAADERKLPLLIHARGRGEYGAAHARNLVELVREAAPGVPVQVAHLWGGTAVSLDALTAYADAIADDGVRNLWFDVSDSALVAQDDALRKALVAQMRRIGFDRLLYGSDAAFEGHPDPKEAWRIFSTTMPLTPDELEKIAGNVAPWLRRGAP
ncbi:MAG TPA: amidohydrolase family protein [Xanthomonadales bacterium]|nr:amidohydrolase family protein [Xanthomonadales bacterium]